MAKPRQVSVVEVGTRDGFQMEATFIPTDTKVEIIEAMIAAGIRTIEATSFVSPRAVPQLADAAEVIGRVKGKGARLTALVPNAKGAERAAEAGIDEMVVFVSASETHNAKNVNRTVAESLRGFGDVALIARDAGIPVHGGCATAFGCPFEGEVPVDSVLRIAERYAELGFAGMGFGDTTGMATPPTVERAVRAVRQRFPQLHLTLHFHNTRGVGLANVMVGLDLGIDTYESSIGGLGGCPFAAGATGNICTEDLVYLLQEQGIETGIDLEQLIKVAHRVEDVLGRTLPGQVMKAGPRLKLHAADAQKAAVG
jgi:hydroxymethylglutaryl-CoA lyase